MTAKQHWLFARHGNVWVYIPNLIGVLWWQPSILLAFTVLRDGPEALLYPYTDSNLATSQHWQLTEHGAEVQDMPGLPAMSLLS